MRKPRLIEILLHLLRRIGAFIGKINTTILMVISFYIILLPIAIVRRLLAKREPRGKWLKGKNLDSKHFEKQF